jgi:hypothetical protein
VLVNDTDAEGSTLTASLVSNLSAGQGSVTLYPAACTFLYTPPATGIPAGPLSFTYRAYDGQAYSNTATVTFTIP